MKQYLLLLPIIFIIHDMEEIIGFRWFFRNNPTIFDRFPRITKAYKDCTTAGMALAVVYKIVSETIGLRLKIIVAFTIYAPADRFFRYNYITQFLQLDPISLL